MTNDRDLRAGEAELPTHAESEGAADEEKRESGPEILQTDHLVIVGPEVFLDESDLVVIVVLVACVGGCFGCDGAHG